jgi:hypothetical protein
MARIEGVRTNGSLFTRFAFYLSRRKLGKVVKPVQVHALHKTLLFGFGMMENAQVKAKRVPAVEKELALMLVARRIGCPW